jgi:hypothetical protein
MATTPYPFVASTVLTASQLNSTFNIPVTTKTASHTLVAGDAGTRVVMNSASATTITVNTSIFSAGDNLQITNVGAGVTTVTAGTATVSSAGPLAIPQYGSGTLYFTSAGVAIFFPSAGPAPTSGLTFITGGTITDTTSVNNCFSATYTNYKIVFNSLVSGTNVQVRMRMRASGSDDSNSLYSFSNLQQNTSTGGTASGGVGRDTTQFGLGSFNNYANGQSLSFDIFNPFAAKNTNYGPGAFFDDEIVLLGFISGVHKSTTSFDGFTIFPTSSTLAGTYKVYGYANS